MKKRRKREVESPRKILRKSRSWKGSSKTTLMFSFPTTKKARKNLENQREFRQRQMETKKNDLLNDKPYFFI